MSRCVEPSAGASPGVLASPDLGLASDDEALPSAVTAYLDAAGECFWHETERIAREHL